jgi:hypothetical protein
MGWELLDHLTSVLADQVANCAGLREEQLQALCRHGIKERSEQAARLLVSCLGC